MNETYDRKLLSGDEAVAQAARDAGVALGAGYPGTPSTEIMEQFSALGGKAQWAPNEKVAFEVALGAAFGGARALVTMKHVGLNVAADPLFTAAYTGVTGGLVVVCADDPGLASSQNEQDNRHYARAAGVPMLEPSDSQESYDFTLKAFALSEQWHTPVLLRMTTRVCHSNTLVRTAPPTAPAPAAHYEKDVATRVMIPSNARSAHKRLAEKLQTLAVWNDKSELTITVPGTSDWGVITSGISYMHVREAAPEASVLKLGMTWPLPLDALQKFVSSLKRCLVIEEGDPFLSDALRAQGLAVDVQPRAFHFGELNVERVRRLVRRDETPEPTPVGGRPPQLCPGCPHRVSFETLRDLNCIVSGDIGCYTLGVLPPFSAMDTCVCMGASVGVGLGLRHVLPPEMARRVVSVIGDSTFMHSGLTGLLDMVYNPPATGHVVLILDNGTTAMTGLQDHPGTGRRLNLAPARAVAPEKLAEAMGISNVHVIDPVADRPGFVALLTESLKRDALTVIVARRACLLVVARNKKIAARQGGAA